MAWWAKYRKNGLRESLARSALTNPIGLVGEVVGEVVVVGQLGDVERASCRATSRLGWKKLLQPSSVP